MEQLNYNKIIAILLFVLLITWGCDFGGDGNSNDDNVPITFIEENLTIGEGAILTYNLGAWSIEGGLWISLQPKKFQVSHIIPNPLGGAQYEYVPAKGFIGKDHVEITRGSSAGDNKIIAKTIHKITIEVTSD